MFYQDKGNLQCRKPKNSSLIVPLTSKNIMARNCCSWLEQYYASAAKLKTKPLSFLPVYPCYKDYKN